MNEVLDQASSIVAPRLIGSILERKIDGHIIRVKIVETEAYDETDEASHSYNGRTQRNDIMFGKSGFMYVYFTYGMHYCANIVTGGEGIGSAVLIRAVEPLEGEEYMKELRHHAGKDLSNGPAKLCQALAIDKRMNGHDLTKSPLKLILRPVVEDIAQTTRIGLSHAKDVPWRFYMKGNEYVSRP